MKERFTPRFQGIYKPSVLAEDFPEQFISRVNAGLFPSAPPARNQYKAENRPDGSLWIRSATLLTSTNIGLNDIRLQMDRRKGEVRYEVSYWKWSKYGVLLSLFLMATIAGALCAALHWVPRDQYPSLGETLFWGVFCAFWGLAWPWILISMHKKPAEKCLLRILDEVNQMNGDGANL